MISTLTMTKIIILGIFDLLSFVAVILVLSKIVSVGKNVLSVKLSGSVVTIRLQENKLYGSQK